MRQVWEYMRTMMSGPGWFRFFVQPVMAILFGILDGRRDNHEGRVPFFMWLRSAHRQDEVVLTAFRRIAVPLCLATGLSLVFQYVILRRVRLLPALLFALVFVALPYFVTRTLANGADSRWHRKHPRRGLAQERR